MPKYLIEVKHSPEELACARVIQVFLASGSHFLSNADWGCGDGVHSAWMIVEVPNRNEALAIVPPAFRADTTIVRLTRFVMDDLEAIFRRHGVSSAVPGGAPGAVKGAGGPAKAGGAGGG